MTETEAWSARESTIPLLREIAELVRTSLPEVFARRGDISWKSDGSPVTAADIFLEDAISTALRNAIPDLVLIGEESYQAGHASLDGWVAVLDPIDGTENFCSGLREWGVSLSVWHERRHAGSLLMLPELGEAIMTGDEPEWHTSRIVGFSSSISDELVAQVARAGEARIMGCAVYNLVNVIRGSYARFVNPVGAFSWDLLGGVALAYEYGCHIRLDGRPYRGELLDAGRRYRVDIRHGRHPDPRQGADSR